MDDFDFDQDELMFPLPTETKEEKEYFLALLRGENPKPIAPRKNHQMEKNTEVQVRLESPFWAGRIGYFQFYTDEETACLSTKPVNDPGEHIYFCVEAEYLTTKIYDRF